MDPHYQKINQRILAGWLVIVAVLVFSYAGEVIKGERTLAYLGMFVPVVVLPWLLCYIIDRKKPGWKHLCNFIVVGYFMMYLFVMLTGSTSMVFSFILPLLSLLVLYHHPKLILFTGVASVLVNLFFIFQNYTMGLLDMSNSKDAEIQIALIVLCFSGSYIASKLYDDITVQNVEYLHKLNTANNDLQNMSLQTITTIVNLIDAKDSYTEGHSRRVSAYSVSLARELGFSGRELEDLRKVALLHDIGKVGVSDLVLNKPGRLTTEEFAAMKLHTVIGSDIIKSVTTIPSLYTGVRNHHERYDGNGYPDGLSGENIPFNARIIAVADAYDAMTSTRVYRKLLPNERVMAELERGAGTQFDPVVAGKLIEMIKAGRLENLSPDISENVG